jgi:hypothetical protein
VTPTITITLTAKEAVAIYDMISVLLKADQIVEWEGTAAARRARTAIGQQLDSTGCRLVDGYWRAPR